MWVGPSLDGTTDDEIDAILTESLEPALVDGEFAGAMVSAAAATGLAVRTDTAATPAAATPSRRSRPRLRLRCGAVRLGCSGGGIDVTPILAVLLVAGGLFLVVRALLKRRASAKAQAVALDTLNRDANRRSSEPTRRSRTRRTTWIRGGPVGRPRGGPVPRGHPHRRRGAAGRLRAAPEAGRCLPGEAAGARRDAREIIARCTTAQQLLDAQEQRFDDLRDLEASAPAQLAA